MRRPTSILAAALALAAAACGGGGATSHDAGMDGRDGAAGGGGGGGAKAGSGGAGTTGAAGTGGSGQDGGAGTGGGDGGSPQIRKLVTGNVALIGSGTDACTNMAGATGDRWCAFLRESALTGAIELWVVNATSLGAGAPVTCDGTSPGCVRLSRTAFFDPQFGAGIHHFYGDTLIYFADAGAGAVNSFVGTAWAWRPGWAAGRKLTSNLGTDCIGSPKGDAISCLQGSQVAAGEFSAELLAGRAPLTDDAPLPSLERLVLAAANDPPESQKFTLNFSDDGSYVAWSGRGKAADPETLKVQKIDDPASRQVVTSDVSRWEMTPDGKSWLWLRAFNYDAAAPSGTLESASFPAGTTPTTLATGVATYHGFPGGSVLFQTATGAELRRMPDRAMPATTQLLDQAIQGVLDFSPDGATVVYVKTFDFNGLVDMYVRNVAAAAPCMIAGPSTAVATATMFAKAGTVLWARLEPTGALQGMAASVESCKSTPFAGDVLRWLPAGDDAVTILDDTAPTADDSTLRYSRLANGVLPAKGTQLATHVTAIYAPAVPNAPAILYTGATMATAGLYVYAGAPLVGTPPATGDGGAPDAAGTEGGASDGAASEVVGADAGGDAGEVGDAGGGDAGD